MATIIKRGNSFQVKIRRQGLPVVSATLSTRTEAEAFARHIETDMDRGTFVDLSLSKRMLFDEVLTRYLADVTPTKRGYEAETSRIKALLRDPIATYGMSALTPKVIAEYRDRRLTAVSPSTVKRELNLIGAIITAAMKDYGIPMPSNPVSQIRHPKSPPGRYRRIAPSEEKAILEALDPPGERDEHGRFQEGIRNPWMRPFFILAIETGARRSDLLRLRWEDVNLERRIAVLQISKNGEGRVLALSTRAVEQLAQLPREDEHVFPITANAVNKAWQRALKAANLKLRFHDTRHEATSRLFEKGLNLIEVSSITGHKDLRMLQRYAHVDAERLAEKLGLVSTGLMEVHIHLEIKYR